MLLIIIFLLLNGLVHSAGPFGINGYIDFVDLVKGAGFNAISGNYTEDANGWPTCDVSWEVTDARRNMMWDGPDPYGWNTDISGTYKLSFVGQADIGGSTEGGAIIVSNQNFDSTTGITTADVTVPANQYLFFLTLSNTKRTSTSTAGTGFTNLHLIKDTYNPNTTQIFTNECINSYGPGFEFIRLLGPDAANNYATLWNDTTILWTYWQNRPKPGDAYQGGTRSENAWPAAGHGLSWEYMILFSNQMNLSPWINVPISVDDTYVTNLANLFKYGSDGVNAYTSAQTNPVWPPLNSNLKIYLEYSNEVWNWGFAQSVWNEYWAGIDNITNDCEYVKRTYTIAKIFRSVYGENLDTVRPVVLWQYGNWDAIKNDLAWLESTYKIQVKDYIWGIGEAPYLDPEDHSSSETILNTLRVNSDGKRSAFLGWKTVATFFGIHEVGYESGPSLSAGIDTIAMRDPRMSDIIQHHYVDNYFAVGGEQVGYFAGGFGASSSCGGTWNQGEDPNNQHSVKMDGILNVFSAPQPAVQIGQALPVNVGDTLSINMSPPDVWGIQPNSFGGAYLLRSEAAGTYKITINGVTDNQNIQEQIYIDDVLVGTSTFPPSGGDAAAITTNSIGAGLHALALKYVYVNGQTSGKASGHGIKITLATGGGNAILPNFPTNPGYKASSSGQVDLYWDVSNGAVSYNIYSAPNNSPFDTFTKIGSSTTNTYSITNLTNGKLYYYSVSAVNSVGETVRSGMVATLPVSGKPNQPSNLKLSQNQYEAAYCGNGGGVIILTWDPVPETYKYNIKRNNGGACGDTYTTTMVPSFSEGGLDTSKAWQYCVTATNQLGESLVSTGVTTTAWSSRVPDAPTNLVATPTNKGVQLKWDPTPLITPSTDPEHRIYRSTTKGGPYNLIFSISVANVTDWTVSNDQTYYYVIKTHGLSGESAASNEATATPTSQGIAKINAGGSDASPFVSDTGFNSGTSTENTTTNIDLSFVGSNYAAPTAVYQTARTATSSQPLTYTFSGLVPNAPYHLLLHFAEINSQNTQVGQRVFHVNVNGGRILSNYDILLRTKKANIAIIEHINAGADNAGRLTVTFTNAKGGNAIINGLEVY